MTDHKNGAEGEGACHGYGHHRGAAKALGFAALAGGLLLLAMFFSELKEYRYIGSGAIPQATVAVNGEGEEYQAPDVAEISFSIVNEAKSISEAKQKVDEAMKKVHTALNEAGIEEKDIKTTGYNFYPKYEWRQSQIMCVTYPCVQPPGKQVLTGYEVTQSVDVKIRKIDGAGEIVTILAENGATNLSNLSFRVENEDELVAKARAKAIAEAKAKADVLAKDLGVKLVRVVSFNEGGYAPMYNYARSEKAFGLGMGGDMAAASADLPVGQSKIVSNVTIVYEIR
ncbi:MAG TPA: SIMPL domain-containing protein [Candidatus Paceibacterota bacterium]|nr:SIMPL domain-containing protein [Candidatus Paceibacterota bacterium]